jgi:hypothetical protein
MKKVTVFVCFWSVFLTQAFSQFSVQLMSKDPYYFHSKDLMNVMIINQVHPEQNVKLKATLKYYENTVVILESRPFLLTQGANLVNLVSEIGSIIWRDEVFREADETTNGLFPGSYTVCYEVFSSLSSSSALIDGKLCENFKIEFPTPLLLAYPFDKSELDEKNPIFNWIAPLPAGLEKNIGYKMSLYENRDNKPKSMILNQRPIAVIETPSTNSNFPSVLNELEQGVKYYWKVDAYLGRVFLVSSEIWEFKLKEPKKILVPEVFVKLNDVNQDIHTARNSLKVIYISEKTTGNMNYKILNPSDGRLLREGTLSYSLGENTWQIPITGLNLENEKFLVIGFSNGIDSYKMKFLPLD